MKQTLFAVLILCSLFLTACNSVRTGETGSLDSQTAIDTTSAGQFGKQHEKRPIKMFNVDGELYYDSGLTSDLTPRCGTLDQNLKKGVDTGKIPHKSGEANFEIDGYQNATSITKEVNINGKWVIFKKYNTFGKSIDDLKYCFYIKGHLNNAAVDSEIIVLSEYADITFNDVYEPLLSSQYPSKSDKGRVIHNSIYHDKWGLTLYPDNVTDTGMTIKFEQFGGDIKGELQTGPWFSLEKNIEDEWKPVMTNPLIDYAWNDVAYIIKKNDITELEVEWKWLYGELSSGFYKLKKEIMNFKTDKSYDKDIYEVHFTIE